MFLSNHNTTNSKERGANRKKSFQRVIKKGVEINSKVQWQLGANGKKQGAMAVRCKWEKCN